MEIDQDSNNDAESLPLKHIRRHQNKKYPKKYITPYEIKPLLCKKALFLFASSNTWKFLFIASILVNFIHVSYNYIFIRENITKLSYLFMIICDTIYIFNYIFLNFNNSSSYCRKTTRIVSVTCLIFDFFLLLPYSYIYEAVFHRSDTLTFFLLRSVSFLRLFHFIFYTPKGVNFILKYIILLFFLHHSIGCLYFIQLHPIGHVSSTNNTIFSPNSLESYTQALYFGVMFTSNRDFANITSKNHFKLIFTSSSMILSFLLLTGIFLGILALKLTHFHHWHSQNKTRNVLEHDFSKLPRSLKQDLYVEINKNFIGHSLIFRNRPENFLREISTHVKYEFFETDALIYQRGVVKDKMIVVEIGALEILSDEDDQSPIVILGPGSCLGEPSLFLTLPAKSTVRAACPSHLRVLHKKDFFRTIPLFPDLYASLHESAIKRVLKAKFNQLAEEITPTSSSGPTPPPKTVVTLFGAKNQPKSDINKFKQMVQGKSVIEYAQDQFLELYKLLDTVEKPKPALCLTAKFPWVFQPNSSLMWSWESIVIFCTCFISVSYPFHICFRQDFSAWMTIASNMAETIFVVDVFIILFTAIETHDHKTVKSFMGILHKRLAQPGFYFDFLSCLHIELFSYAFSDKNRLFYVLKLNRLLKSYRIAKLFAFLIEKNAPWRGELQFCKFFLYFLVVSYWFGNMLNLVTPDSCTDSVLVCWYFAVECVARLVRFDFAPEITGLVYLFVISGIFLFVYCTAELFATISVNFQQKNVHKAELVGMKRILERNALEKSFCKRIEHSFEVRNSKGRVEDEDVFDTLNGIALFSGMNVDFIRFLTKTARIVTIPPNEVVIYEGEVHEYAYVIQKGFCIYKNEHCESVIGPGKFFGNVSFMPKVVALFMVGSLTHVDLICLDQRDVTKLFSVFTTIQNYYKKALDESELRSLIRRYRNDIPDRFEYRQDVKTKHKKNIINVVTYCKTNKERYLKSCKEAGPLMFFLQIFLLPFCILPSSKLLKFWMMLRAAIATVIVILTPFHLIQVQLNQNLEKTVFFLDIVTYFDLYVMMFVGFYGKKNQLVVHPVRTAWNYITGRFFIDCVLCFPWEMCWKLAVGRENVALCLIKMGQIYRIPHLFNYFTNRVETRKAIILVIVQILTGTLFAVYFWTVILTFTATYNTGEKTSNFDSSSFSARNFTKFDGIYVLAAYFTTNILTGSGFDYFYEAYVEKNSTFLLISIFMALFGMLYFCCVYALIASFYANWNNSHARIKQQMADLKRFMSEEGINRALHQLIVKHFETVWICSQNVQVGNMLNGMQPALHKDIVYSMFGESVLWEIPIFEDVHTCFFRLLAKEVELVFFARGEIICRSENVTSSIYIICKGQVEIIKVNGRQTVMTTGGVFGNITPLPKNKICDTIVAITDLECLQIENEVFFAVVKKYPSLYARLKNVLAVDCDYIKSKISSNTLKMDQRSRLVTNLSPYTSLTENKLSSATSSTALTIISDDNSNCTNCFYLFFPWKWCHVTISPYFILCKFVDCFCTVSALINCFFVAYHLAFQHHCSAIFALTMIIDVFFYVKLTMDFHKSFEDKFGELILSNNQIMNKFFKSNRLVLALKLIGNSPLHLFTVSVDKGFYYSCFRTLTILKLIYVYEVFHKQTKKVTFSRIVMLLWTFYWFSLMVHLMACAWYILACPWGECKKNFWTEEYLELNYDKIDLYVICVYFTIGLVTFSSTSSDLQPTNYFEVIFVIFAMIFATFLVGFFLGDFVKFYNLSLSTREMCRLEVKQGKNYLKKEHLQRNLVGKFKEYAKNFCRQTKRAQIMPDLIRELPYDLKCEVMLDAYGHLLRNSYVFSETEDAFIRQLASYVKINIFWPKEYIVKHGDSDQTMYFIHCGKVDILTIREDSSKMIHEILYSEDMFGLVQGLFYNVPHHFSFRARSLAYVVSLRLPDWEDLLKFFPHSKNIIYAKANDMYCNI